MTRSQRMVRILSPLLFGATLPLVSGLALTIVIAMERTFGLHVLFRVGDVDCAIALGVVGVAIYIPSTHLLAHFEELQRHAFWVHLRHTAVLYSVAIGGGAWLAASYEALNGNLQYGYVTVLVVAAGFGIVLNSATIAVRSWRFNGWRVADATDQ